MEEMVSVLDGTESHESGMPVKGLVGETGDTEEEQGLLLKAEPAAVSNKEVRQAFDAADISEGSGNGHNSDLFSTTMLLYCSHFLSRWGDRMWEFAVALFMVEVWPDSLLLAALYGLTESGAMAAFGVLIGTWVDSHPRLKVVKVALSVQNSCVATAAIAVVLLLHMRSAQSSSSSSLSSSSSSSLFVALVVFVNVLGGVGSLAGLARNIAIERDWVVAMTQDQPAWVLPRVNATMRRIDLCCKLLAPIAVGAIMSLASLPIAAIAIAAWNLLSFAAELSLLLRVHAAVPALSLHLTATDATICTGTAEEEFIEPHGRVGGEGDQHTEEGTAQLLGDPSCTPKTRSRGDDELDAGTLGLVPCMGMCSRGVHHAGRMVAAFIEESREGLQVYAMQEVFLAAFALACLYLTVISFGTLMTAWLGWQGVPMVVLGLARGLAAAVGIGATLLYPVLQSYLSTVRTGLWAIWMQWMMLVGCVAAVFVHSTTIASSMLIAGVVASRLGLWMFDLSVTQLMQESVGEGSRGVVGGVQSALQETMELASFACGILLPKPQDFGYLVLLSFAMVSCAALLYTRFSFNTRGHLWHLEKLRPLLLSSRVVFHPV